MCGQLCLESHHFKICLQYDKLMKFLSIKGFALLHMYDKCPSAILISHDRCPSAILIFDLDKEHARFIAPKNVSLLDEVRC